MEWFFLALQIVFVGVAIAGIAMVNVPLAVFALGVAGAWAMQRSLIALDAAKKDKQQKTVTR